MDIIAIFPSSPKISLRDIIHDIDNLLNRYSLKRKNFIMDKCKIYVQISGDNTDITKLKKDNAKIEFLDNSSFDIIH